MRTRSIRKSVAASVAAALLAACGGGGGGGGGTTSHTLSGRIAVTENAAVDSDLNDTRQTPWVINDSDTTAQPITAPVLLVGTVNVVNAGPPGLNQSSGDYDDFFKVDLVAGQVVELEFASDPTAADVDLYVTSADGSHHGESIGQDSRYECVKVTAAATYFVDVRAFQGASIYNLRIGAPGSGDCVAFTSSARFVPNELVAKPRVQAQAAVDRMTLLLQSAGVRSLSTSGDAGLQLLSLPNSAPARAAGLATLAAASSTGASRRAATARASASSLVVMSDTIEYAKRLRKSGSYEYVEPNWIMERQALVGTLPPNDRGYPYQRWHYEQIELPAAMATINGLATQPTRRPVVAIIDDGVVLDHPDLKPQLFSPGRSFISTDPGGDHNSDSGDNPSAPSDNPIFHGTHVAGTVAAAGFDGIGGIGVAPMAQLLPLRVFAPGKGASSYDTINAILYAAGLLNNASADIGTRRADVINMSLGSDSACSAGYQDAISQARSREVIVVAAAGNSGHNDQGQRAAVGSPANCAGVIAVSATEAHKQITYYSNTGINGTSITVAAPGGDTSQSSTGNGAPDGVYSDLATFDAAGNRQPTFGPMPGTSMASPHVAGVMALIRYINPAITVGEIDALIANGSLTDDLGTVGKDVDYGYGLINARKAVDAALASLGGSAPPPPVGQVVASPSSIDFGSFQTSAVLTLQTTGTTSTQVTSVTSSNPAIVTVAPKLIDATTRLGTYTVTVIRAALPAGTSYPTLTVMLSSGSAFTVQLAATQSGASGKGSYGPMYVLLIDPDTQKVIDTVLAAPTSGGYTWSKTGYTGSKVSVVAGSDLDNDDIICARGEPCGAYPVLSAEGDLSVITLSGDRSDLNFQVAPLSGISVARAGASGARVWRRTATPPLPPPSPSKRIVVP